MTTIPTIPTLLTSLRRHSSLYRYLKTGCSRRREATISQRIIAAGIIQGFVRCVLARRRAMVQAMIVYRRIYDEEYQVGGLRHCDDNQ